MKSNLIILLILAIIFNCNISYSQKEETIPFNTVAKGYTCGIQEEKKVVINNMEEWKNLWSDMEKYHIPKREVPYYDFATTTLVGVFIGNCSTTRHSIDITKIVENNEKIIVYYKQFVPMHGGHAITQPFHVVSIDKTDKQIEFLREKLISEYEDYIKSKNLKID